MSDLVPERARPVTEQSDLTPDKRDLWRGLSRFTPARIALGRVGASLPTGAALEFGMAHARARDAVHAALDTEVLARNLQAAGFATWRATSLARSRAEYLARPDLGRQLASPSGITPAARIHLLTVVVADGLSALAPARHAVGLLTALRPLLRDWFLDDVVIATQARVALGDEVGERRGAEAVLVLIGERPGLQASDSLGAYLTYRPRTGCLDAERNCVSNIRDGGLGYAEAARRIGHLLDGARSLGTSGVGLKEDAEAMLEDGKEVIPP